MQPSDPGEVFRATEAAMASMEPSYRRSTGLVDVLDRVLDKGLVVAGDIRVSLAEVELLTIRIRLLICSIDKAEQIGLDWWRQDPNLSVAARQMAAENDMLREQIRLLEARLGAAAKEVKPEVKPEAKTEVKTDTRRARPKGAAASRRQKAEDKHAG
jgi:hypothetical protein